MPISLRRALVAAPLLAALVGPVGAASPPTPGWTEGESQSYTYRWKLTGIVGRVAGLVLPSHGRAELRSRPTPNPGRHTELEITSPEGAAGEFFLYGATTGADGYTKEAWSAYKWRDEEKSKRAVVEEEEVVDVASGIQLIRARRPSLQRMRIWSDGKIYPVVVRRGRRDTVTVPAGTFEAELYQVRGLKIPGERFWKGGLDLWLARDAAATPLSISVNRGWANVVLELVDDGG